VILTAQTYLLELYRAGLRTASDIAKASLENAQRLHAQQLSEASSITDLMALQVKLAGTQAEQATDFWTRAWRTASETHVAMLGQVQTQVGQLGERVRETYNAATRAAEGAVNDTVESAREVERKAQRRSA